MSTKLHRENSIQIEKKKQTNKKTKQINNNKQT
jgi:hypothetical protein